MYTERFLGHIYLGGMVLKRYLNGSNRPIHPCIFRENGNLASDRFPNNPNMTETTLVSTNYELAYKHFLKAADSGDVFSTMMVGQMYHCGCGVKQDFTKAFNWYNRIEKDAAVYQSYAESNTILLYALGDGAIQDLHRIHRDDILGYYNLAQLYYHGHLISQNYKAAFSFLSKVLGNYWRDLFYVIVKISQSESSELTSKNHQGYLMVSREVLTREIQYQLGIMLENGQGTRKNYRKAFNIFSEAMKNGSIEAKDHLETHYKNGIYIGDKIKQS